MSTHTRRQFIQRSMATAGLATIGQHAWAAHHEGSASKSGFKFALCNEMFEGKPMGEVFAIAKRLGYHGIEIAPFTLNNHAANITNEQRSEIRQLAKDTGLEVVGLHWLFVGPKNLHMTTPDDTMYQRTVEYMRTLIQLCADIEGKVLVLGSPKQRSLVDGQTQEGAWKRAVDFMEAVIGDAEDAGVIICMEPLGPNETDFINTVAEGVRLAKAIDSPHLKVTLDVKAMWTEPEPIADVIRATDVKYVGHVQVNDANLYGPGMGDVDYAPIAAALRDIGWNSWLSVEVFKYDPDPETIARKSIEYLRKHFS